VTIVELPEVPAPHELEASEVVLPAQVGIGGFERLGFLYRCCTFDVRQCLDVGS